MTQVTREKVPQEALDHMQLGGVIHMLEGCTAIQRAHSSWGKGQQEPD